MRRLLLSAIVSAIAIIVFPFTVTAIVLGLLNHGFAVAVVALAVWVVLTVAVWAQIR